MANFKPSTEELEIIYGYARGDSDTVIGKILGRKANTVAVMASRMRLRMGAKDRAHTVQLAHELRILSVGGDQS